MFQVVGVCLFGCCNGTCKSGLLPPKYSCQMRHFILTQGKHHVAFSYWIPVTFVLQFMIQMAKLNRVTEDQNHICSRAENFAHHFTTKKTVWENSDIKCIKVSSTD